MDKSKEKKKELKVFCVFLEEGNSFSDVIKQIFKDYLISNLK